MTILEDYVKQENYNSNLDFKKPKNNYIKISEIKKSYTPSNLKYNQDIKQISEILSGTAYTKKTQWWKRFRDADKILEKIQNNSQKNLESRLTNTFELEKTLNQINKIFNTAISTTYYKKTYGNYGPHKKTKEKLNNLKKYINDLKKEKTYEQNAIKKYKPIENNSIKKEQTYKSNQITIKKNNKINYKSPIKLNRKSLKKSWISKLDDFLSFEKIPKFNTLKKIAKTLEYNLIPSLAPKFDSNKRTLLIYHQNPIKKQNLKIKPKTYFNKSLKKVAGVALITSLFLNTPSKAPVIYPIKETKNIKNQEITKNNKIEKKEKSKNNNQSILDKRFLRYIYSNEK